MSAIILDFNNYASQFLQRITFTRKRKKASALGMCDEIRRYIICMRLGQVHQMRTPIASTRISKQTLAKVIRES